MHVRALLTCLFAAASMVAVGARAQTPTATEPTPGRPRDLVRVRGLDEQGAADRWAVVIGVGKYRDPAIQLRYPAADARSVADMLEKRSSFARDHIKLLVDEDATAANIRTALGTWLPQVAGRQDMVVIYFSGHGAPDLDPGVAEDGIRKYLIPYDARTDDLFGTAVPMDDLSASLLRLRSEQTVVLLDCCYSGTAASAAGGAPHARSFPRPGVSVEGRIKSGFVDSLALSGRGRAVMTGCDPGERAFEYDDLKHGAFTYYLLQGLDGEAADPATGQVSVDGLYRYVYTQLRKGGTDNTRAPQTPILATSVAGVLSLSAPTGAAGEVAGSGSLKVTTSPLGATVYIDRETEPRVTPFSAALGRGSHRITVYKPGYLPETEEVFVSPVRPAFRSYVLRVEETQGDLLLETETGARISVDGRDTGATLAPLTRFANLPAGSHAIRAERDGFATSEQTALVPKGGAVLVRIPLSKTLPGLRAPGPGETPAGLSGAEGGGSVWQKDHAAMVFVAPGAFIMGSDDTANARPRHSVTVAGFWVDRTETTAARYAEFVKETSYKVKGDWVPPSGVEEGKLPAARVTLDDARAYAVWAGKRLPTEAEWEKAARGTDERPFPYGTVANPLLQNGRSYGIRRALPVGSLPGGASPYGALDMLGNVWEWCDSVYEAYPGNAGFDTNANKKNYCLRGGSFLLPAVAADLGVTLRAFSLPNIGQEDVGFRCVISAP